MLYWVGKKPIGIVESYPAQLVETIGDTQTSETPNYSALEQNWSNLLFHGDNKEILGTLLVNGFRGKVDLIYIDPPFDSGADYVRKVELRGTKEKKLEGEEQTALEQVQYEDIWANDNYLQFMYERLILLRELLSEQGSIYLHCDWHKAHHLRMLMDEVFGADNFINEIIWHYTSGNAPKNAFAKKHDNILAYSLNKNRIFNQILKPLSDFSKEKYDQVDENGKRFKLVNGYKKYLPEQGIPVDDTWDIPIENVMSSSLTDYPTQKPEALLERIITASSNPGSIVLDCFVGSGTTAAVAEKLGRRWIGADINKGSIQTTMKRLQKTAASGGQELNILHYRVNNYDFQQISALRAMIVEKYGIEESKTDVYFDGVVGGRLVKIAELNRPVTKLDLESITNELRNRPTEDRDVLLIGSGVELSVYTALAERQQLQGAPNQIEVKDIQRDGIIVAEPAEAAVAIEKSGGKAQVAITNYLSPTIIKRLAIDRSIFGERIKDFRAQIDTVLIDTDYDGKTFNIVVADVPARKQDLVQGTYELELAKSDAQIAVKITDMLGEETLVIG